MATTKPIKALNPDCDVEPNILRCQAGGVGYLCGNGSKTAGGETFLRGEISDTPVRGHFLSNFDLEVLRFIVGKFKPFADDPGRFYGYSSRKLMMKMGLDRRDPVRVNEIQKALKLLKKRGFLSLIHVRPNPRFTPTEQGVAAANNGGA